MGTSALAPRDMRVPVVLHPALCQGAQPGDSGPEPAAGSLLPLPGSPLPSPSLSASQILCRYDVVLVQEVRDSDLSAVTQLMEQLNR